MTSYIGSRPRSRRLGWSPVSPSPVQSLSLVSAQISALAMARICWTGMCILPSFRRSDTDTAAARHAPPGLQSSACSIAFTSSRPASRVSHSPISQLSPPALHTRCIVAASASARAPWADLRRLGRCLSSSTSGPCPPHPPWARPDTYASRHTRFITCPVYDITKIPLPVSPLHPLDVSASVAPSRTIFPDSQLAVQRGSAPHPRSSTRPLQCLTDFRSPPPPRPHL
ncbi:hypothetical protein C8Q80DRAFT_413329 [Daedaleopsis nitida]|nr:hypothetical protein C8Q80DRAFT_413329 [Daedaleopsis nitida]